MTQKFNGKIFVHKEQLESDEKFAEVIKDTTEFFGLEMIIESESEDDKTEEGSNWNYAKNEGRA